MNKLIKKALSASRRGDQNTAASLYKKILRSNPSDLDANFLLGTLYAEQQQLQQAEPYLLKASAINPASAQVWNNLGNVYKQLGYLEKAANCYRSALNNQWGLLQAHYNLAVVLKQLGDPEGALQHYEIAYQQNPNFVEALAGSISIMEMNGQYSTAREKIQPLVEGGTRNAVVAKLFADLILHGDFPSADQQLAVDLLANLFEENKTAELIAPHMRKPLSFCMGQLLDKLGRYEEALAFFVAGNRLQNADFDSAAHSRYVDEIIVAYSPEAVVQMPRREGEGASLVFIVGMPRSGSTLVDQILYSHPDMASVGESDLFVQALSAVRDSHQAAGLSEAETQVVGERFSAMLEARHPAGGRVVDKTLLNFLQLGKILQVFPEAQIVTVVREPLDNCLSCFFHDFAGGLPFSYDLQTLGNYYRDHERLMAHWAAVFPGRILRLEYAQLTQQPEASIHKLLQFCGLAWDPAVERFHEAQRFVTTSSYHQVRKPIYTTALNRNAHYAQFLRPLREGLGSGGGESAQE